MMSTSKHASGPSKPFLFYFLSTRCSSDNIPYKNRLVGVSDISLAPVAVDDMQQCQTWKQKEWGRQSTRVETRIRIMDFSWSVVIQANLFKLYSLATFIIIDFHASVSEWSKPNKYKTWVHVVTYHPYLSSSDPPICRRMACESIVTCHSCANNHANQ